VRNSTSRASEYSLQIQIYIELMAAPSSALHEARRRLDLTQAQAAQLLATSQANISAYERGRLVPGRIVAERIDALAALTPESLYAT